MKINILIIASGVGDVCEPFDIIEERVKRDRINPDECNIIHWRLSKDNNKIEYSDSIKIYRTKINVWYKLIPFVTTRLLFNKFLKENNIKPDITLVYSSYHASILGSLIKSTGSDLVYCITNHPIDLAKTRSFPLIRVILYSILSYLASSFVSVAYVISQTTYEYAKKYKIGKKGIVLFTPDSISRDSKFIKSNDDLIEYNYINRASNKIRILSVGRLEKEKGYLELIDIINQLPDNISLTILGKGELYGVISEKINRLGLSNRIKLVGHVDREVLWNYYYNSDYFILLSKSEALGLVFLEALYSGLPVIGSTAPGIKETIGENKDRGLLWNIGDDISTLNNFINITKTSLSDRLKRIKENRIYVDSRLNETSSFNDVVKLLK